MSGSPSSPQAEDKPSWRRRMLAARRRRRDDQDVHAAAARTALVLSLPEVASARTVAAYVSVATEPPTDALLGALVRRNVEVLVPALLPGGELEWGHWTGSQDLVEGPFGLREPTGARLGPDAVARADVVVCPGLAVDRSGTRLGRGGGSYDRALAGTRPDALRLVLLDDGEVVDVLPAEPHDEPVHIAVTPTRILRLRTPG